MQLQCPVCQQTLSQHDRQLRCPDGHSFDAARQGYWNLLLPNRKRSRDPGDNQAMVQARRQFLDLGCYQPLSDAVNQLAAEALQDITAPQILDTGCGEGYYTDRLYQHLQATGEACDMAALDISKHAIKAACQRNRQITWLVASAADIPLPEQSLDLQLLMFSRLMPQAMARPMKTAGALLIAWPGNDHLRELREIIYDQVRDSRLDVADELKDGFQLEKSLTVQDSFTLQSAEQVEALLAMTPHGQRLTEGSRQSLLQQVPLQLTLDVNLAWFRRL